MGTRGTEVRANCGPAAKSSRRSLDSPHSLAMTRGQVEVRDFPPNRSLDAAPSVKQARVPGSPNARDRGTQGSCGSKVLVAQRTNKDLGSRNLFFAVEDVHLVFVVAGSVPAAAGKGGFEFGNFFS